MACRKRGNGSGEVEAGRPQGRNRAGGVRGQVQDPSTVEMPPLDQRNAGGRFPGIAGGGSGIPPASRDEHAEPSLVKGLQADQFGQEGWIGFGKEAVAFRGGPDAAEIPPGNHDRSVAKESGCGIRTRLAERGELGPGIQCRGINFDGGGGSVGVP